jgi:glycosyltransferase involved in cell wall biosynthesis
MIFYAGKHKSGMNKAKKLKIALIVNPLIPVPPEQYGGIERIVYLLIQELLRRGHTVTLYAHPDSAPGCELVAYRESGSYPVKEMLRINQLTFKIAHAGYDLVHTFGRMSNIALLLLHKIPKIVSYQLPPTLSQVKKAVRLARRNSLHFTGCSDYISRQIADYGQVVTIYNGVDLDDYQYQASVAAEAPLVWLGRIQEEKGTAVAISAARLANKKLIIAGNIPAEGHHQRYFKEQVAPFIDGVHVDYIGPVNNLQKNLLLGKAAAFLMPVLWDEPFGIVMAEALACGTPVIGFKRGSVPEVVQNGINGFICENLDGMVSAVADIGLISRNACRRVAEEKFSAGVLAGQYEQLYLKMTRI